MKSARLLLLAMMLVAGCSQTMTVEYRPGSSLEQASAEHNACHTRVKAQPQIYVPGQPTLEGAAAAGVAAGVSSVIQEEQAVTVCMERLGYRKHTLTKEETKQVRSAPRGPARAAIAERILQAKNPVPEALAPPPEAN